MSTWATRADHVTNGGSQLVRLYKGTGRVEADGSATVEWDGSYSVNFYGGLAPFTLSDPVLTVDDAGDGELTADLVGLRLEQSEPVRARRCRRPPTSPSRPSPGSRSTRLES